MNIKGFFKAGMLLILTTGIFLSSCNKDKEEKIEPKHSTNGSAEFTISFNENLLKAGSSFSLDSLELIKQAVVSIEKSSGIVVHELKAIQLLKFGNEFISEPIPLEPGDYKLTKFVLTDNEGNVLYAAPINDSPLANTVANPLPIDFAISLDEVTKVVPEVISVNGYVAADFGYATFSFQIIDTFDFLLGVFVYNESQNNLELTDANIEIYGDGTDLIYSATLEAITNQIILNAAYSEYTINITKQGYSSYNQDFTLETLAQYSETPLTVILSTAEYNTIVLQPDGDEGKDAQIWSYDPTGILDRGTNRQDIVIYEWTKNGAPTTKYGLIEFDLTNLPQNIEIASAEMTLYFDPSSIDNQYHYGHCTYAGPNEAYVRRVTSEWEEPVHWGIMPTFTTENEILLPASTSPTQDYTFDVTGLVNDSYNDLDNSHGFIIQMKDQQYYKSLIFASSEHPNAALHPKLVITYKNN